MRLHAKVAVNASNTYIGRFPVLPCEIESLCDEDHSINIDKVRTALKGSDLITWSSNDDAAVLAFATELMRQMSCSVMKMEEDDSNTVHTTVQDANERSLKRRLDRGKYASCRVDIDKVNRKLRIRLGYANPQGLIGAADKSCQQFLLHIARVLIHITDQLTEERVPVILQGTGDITDIFDEARFINRKCDAEKEIDAANSKRETCVNKVGEYCSPASPDCKCYCNGKCIECTLEEKWLHTWEEIKNDSAMCASCKGQ